MIWESSSPEKVFLRITFVRSFSKGKKQGFSIPRVKEQVPDFARGKNRLNMQADLPFPKEKEKQGKEGEQKHSGE